MADEPRDLTPAEIGTQVMLQKRAGASTEGAADVTRSAFTGNVQQELARMREQASSSSLSSGTYNREETNILNQIEPPATGTTTPQFTPYSPANVDYGVNAAGESLAPSGATQGGMNGLSALQQAQLRLVEEQRAALQRQEESQKALAEAQFRQESARTEEAGKQRTARMQWLLNRSGAINAASGVDYLSQTEAKTQRELQAIDQKRFATLREIDAAFASKDIELAQSKLELLKDFEKQKQEAEDRALDNALKVERLEEYRREKTGETVQSWAAQGFTFEDMPEGYLESIDRAQELPTGTTAALFGAAVVSERNKNLDRETEAQKDELAMMNSMFNILSKVPEDREVEIPWRGEIVKMTGMKEVKPNVYETLQTDAKTGQMKFVQIDRETGETNIIPLPIQSGQGWHSSREKNGDIITWNEFTGETRTIVNGQDVTAMRNANSFVNNFVASNGGQITQYPDTQVSYIGGRSLHGGWDIAVPVGTGVYTPVAGRVVDAQTGQDNATTGWGNYVVVEGSDGKRHKFAHLSNVGVRIGDQVSAGSALGATGNTGYSTGPHLHYEVLDQNGNPIINHPNDPRDQNLVSDPDFYSTGGDLQKKLAKGEVTRANAWNQMKATWPDISNAKIDEVLDKEKYYGVSSVTVGDSGEFDYTQFLEELAAEGTGGTETGGTTEEAPWWSTFLQGEPTQ